MADVPKSDKWIVTSRNPNKNNRVVRVWGKKKDGVWKFKHSKEKPGDEWKCRFGKKATAQLAYDFAESKGNVPRMSKDKFSFCVLVNGVYGDDSLTKKLDKLGKKEGKYIRLGSYKRTQKQQHDLYLAYIRGYGNLAAKCNSRYTGEHSWDQCKQYPPCYSNHCGGKACDTSYYHQGRSGSYTNVGNNSSFRSTMKSLNICLPVGGEPWHVEHGNTWRS